MTEMKRFQFRLFVLTAIAGAAVACSGSEEDDGHDHDAAADTSGGDTSGQDTAVEDGPAEDTAVDEGSEPAVSGFCVNDADLAIIQSADADPAEEGDQTVTQVAQGCGLVCLGEDDPRACSVTCISDKTTVTAACSGCYGDVVTCSIENCLASCAVDPASEACATCQAENCLPAFYTCTGLEPSGGSGEGSM